MTPDTIQFQHPTYSVTLGCQKIDTELHTYMVIISKSSESVIDDNLPNYINLVTDIYTLPVDRTIFIHWSEAEQKTETQPHIRINPIYNKDNMCHFTTSSFLPDHISSFVYRVMTS